MLQAILKTLIKNAPLNVLTNAPLNAPVNLTNLKTPEAIIALIQNNPEITRQQMKQLINKDIRTIARAIKKLQQQNKFKRIGSDKTGCWQLL